MSAAGYRALTAEAEILAVAGGELKVLRLPDQRAVKLFRIKARLSSALLYPYSVRFARNARRLRALGVRSVQVEQVFFCPSPARHGVIYPLLAGQALLTVDIDPALRRRLARFIARLHAQGIFFRSLHLGNILLMPDGEFALIDVADMRFLAKPLSTARRIRNFRHLLRVPEHRTILAHVGLDAFQQEYLDACGYTGGLRDKLDTRLTELVTALNPAT